MKPHVLAVAAVLTFATGLAAAADLTPKLIDWMDLIPPDVRNAPRPPPRPQTLHDFLAGEPGDFPVEQPGDSEVNRALDGLQVRIPGFVVPLEMDEGGRITELFLVPYFGACIHVPPPPPNQIIFVRIEQGMKVDSMYGAYWLTGRLTARARQTRYGSAAYTLVATAYQEYDY